MQLLSAVEHIIPRASFEASYHADGTKMFTSLIAGTSDKLYIYDIEAGIFGSLKDLRFEEWNYRTPEELIAAVVSALNALHAT